MKKTIKEELATRYIKEELLDDNNLLQYAADDSQDSVCIKIRYVEGNTIKEIVLAILSKEDFKERKVILNFNQDKTAIAIKERIGREYRLTKLYSLKDHSFSNPDFMEMEYRKLFNICNSKVYAKREMI